MSFHPNRRSSASTFFSVNSISPIFAYSSPWIPGFSRQTSGYDRFLYQTSTSNSSISFNVAASSISLVIPPFEDCKATISINGTESIDACSSDDSPFTVKDLPLGLHDMIYHVGPLSNGTDVIFWGIESWRPADIEGMTNVTFDDTIWRSSSTSAKLEYNGDWSHLSEGYSSGFSEGDEVDLFLGHTVSVTQRQGASITLETKGSAIYLYGKIGPDYGSASISLDGDIVAPMLKMTYPWAVSYELLWCVTDLEASDNHVVIMTNLADDKMAFDFAIVSMDKSDISPVWATTTLGIVVLAIVIPVGLFLSVAAVCWYFTRCRPNKRDKPFERRSRLRIGSKSSTEEDKENVQQEIFIEYETPATLTPSRNQQPTPALVSPISPVYQETQIPVWQESLPRHHRIRSDESMVPLPAYSTRVTTSSWAPSPSESESIPTMHPEKLACLALLSEPTTGNNIRLETPLSDNYSMQALRTSFYQSSPTEYTNRLSVEAFYRTQPSRPVSSAATCDIISAFPVPSPNPLASTPPTRSMLLHSLDTSFERYPLPRSAQSQYDAHYTSSNSSRPSPSHAMPESAILEHWSDQHIK